MNILTIQHIEGKDSLCFQVRQGNEGKTASIVDLPSPWEWPVAGVLAPLMELLQQGYPDELFNNSPLPDTDMAERVEQALRAWGMEVFARLFENRDGGELYLQATQNGMTELCLRIISNNPEVLGWPWEALNNTTFGTISNQCKIERGPDILPARDENFLKLEEFIEREKPAILIHGADGPSKTSLMLTFLNWLKETEGFPHTPLWISLQETRCVETMVNEVLDYIPLNLPHDFSLYPIESKIDLFAIPQVKEIPLIVVLDHFEYFHQADDDDSFTDYEDYEQDDDGGLFSDFENHPEQIEDGELFSEFDDHHEQTEDGELFSEFDDYHEQTEDPEPVSPTEAQHKERKLFLKFLKRINESKIKILIASDDPEEWIPQKYVYHISFDNQTD